jgi:hypothetical protein
MALLSFMARLGLDATGFEKNMAKANSQVENFSGKTLGALKASLASAFAVAVIIEKFKDAINYAGELTDQMKRLGVSSEFLQGWAHGLELAGAKAEDLTSFLEKLAVSREKALGGDSGALGSFAGLGVSLKDIESTDLEGLARKIAKVFTTGKPQDFIKSLREIGGRSAGALIPAFVENIEDAEREASKLGLVMDKETRVALDALGDAFTTAGKKSKIFFAGLVKSAIDSESRLISLTKAVVDFSKTLIAEGKDNPENWTKRRPISEVAHDAMTSRYLRERESGTGLIGSGALALGDFIAAHFQDGGSGPGDQFANAMKSGKNAYALNEAIAKAQRDAALKADGASTAGDTPGRTSALARAVEASRFQSSAGGSITAAGGYFLGSGQTAAMDIAKQALDLAKRQLDANARTARSAEKIANEGVTVREDPTDP